jgi:hypothetical protein
MDQFKSRSQFFHNLRNLFTQEKEGSKIRLLGITLNLCSSFLFATPISALGK